MHDPSLIVGLGNPGPEYRNTRHNAGFMLADRLAANWGWRWRIEKKFFAEIAEGTVGVRSVVLCKPQTYMNVSGESVGALARYHRIEAKDVMVVVDDADLPLGTIRLRPDGSPGGHHGLESVEKHLGTRDYPRLRVGIARPTSAVRDIANHVLGRFSAEEMMVLEKVLDRSSGQAETWLRDGVTRAMNLYNGAIR